MERWRRANERFCTLLQREVWLYILDASSPVIFGDIKIGNSDQPTIGSIDTGLSPYGIGCSAPTAGSLLVERPLTIVTPEISAFVDSSGGPGSIVDLGENLINYTAAYSDPTGADVGFVPKLQILGCLITIDDHVATIDSQTQVLENIDLPTIKTSSSWSEFRGTEVSSDYSEKDAKHFTMRYWAEYMTSTASSVFTINTELSIDSSFTAAKLYLMKGLRYNPDSIALGVPSRSKSGNATIHELENALSGLGFSMAMNINSTGINSSQPT